MLENTAGSENADGGENRALIVTVEALLVASLVFGAIFFGMSYFRQRPEIAARTAREANAAAFSIPDLTEAEDLPFVAKKGTFDLAKQDTSTFRDGMWSKSSHLFAVKPAVHDWIEMLLPTVPPGAYKVFVFLTRAPDYGVLRFRVNDLPIAEPIDLFSPVITPTGALYLGQFELKGKNDRLRIDVVGRNPQNREPHYQFAIDGIKVLR